MPRGAKTEFSADIGAYLAGHSRQDDVLARVEADLKDQPNASMQVQPDQGALLTLLVRAIGAKDALEVGTFTGYSAICIARGLPQDGHLTCLELSPEYAASAQRNLEDAGVAERVTIEIGPAGESLRRMPETPSFDFAFLDADKPGYLDYYELILPRLRTNGLLLVDNALLGGRVLDPDGDSSRTVAELNERITEDERVDSAIVFIADGVGFVRKR